MITAIGNEDEGMSPAQLFNTIRGLKFFGTTENRDFETQTREEASQRDYMNEGQELVEMGFESMQFPNSIPMFG